MKRADHGTTTKYARGCRCPRCRAANAQYQRDYKARTRPAPADRPLTMFAPVEPLTAEHRAMVEANIGLVWMVVNKLPGDDFTRDDSYQDGMFGLMRAAQKFDPSRGFAFSTYAVGWIRGMAQRGRFYREGNASRAATERGEVYVPPMSLQAPIGDEGLTLGDTLILEDRPDPCEGDHRSFGEMVEMLRSLAEGSTEQVVAEAFVRSALTGDPISDRLLAEQLAMSQSTVTNARQRLMTRLRHPVHRKLAKALREAAA